MVVLRTHIKTVHTGTRPYHCQQCPDAFKTKGSLVRHVRRHTGKTFMDKMFHIYIHTIFLYLISQVNINMICNMI